MAAYAIAIIGVKIGYQITQEVLQGVRRPAWLAHEMNVAAELARGIVPYVTASVVICLGLGAHLPGTRATSPAPDR